MPSDRPDNSELLDLLDALCDERLTAEQAARLERLVLADRAARRLYLDYLHLHGTLLWDAARDDGLVAPEPAALAVASPRSVPARRPRRSVAAAATLAACLVLVLVLVVGWRFRAAERPEPVIADGSDVARPADPPAERDRQRPERRDLRPVTLPGRSIVAATPAEARPPVVAPRPEVIAASDADVVAFLDAELERGWSDAGVTPSPIAGDAEWLRRVYLDLVGHVPPAETAEAFLADKSPDKRAAVLDRLLAEPGFDRHFATVWTNLLVGRSPAAGVDRAALFAFLRRSFAENRSWDETVAAFVAADGPVDENPAANFLVAHLNNEAVPATAITARVFLGTQVQCMQCHDHPFNKWTQRDFWELNGFFQQTALAWVGGKPTLVRKPVGGATTFENRNGLMQAAYPKFDGRAIDPGPAVDRRAELAKLLAEGDRPQLAVAFVNRVWAQLLGAGFVNPVDDLGPHNAASHPEALDRLARAFAASDYDVKKLVRWVCSTRSYQLSSRFGPENVADDPESGTAPLFSRVYPKPMSAEQVYDSLMVATRSGASAAEAVAARDDWVRQFVRAYETDENDEAVHFDGGIAQALALMNGDLVRQGVAAAPGTTLHDVLADPAGDAARLRRLWLATLSRPPAPKELAAANRLLRQAVAAAPPNRRTAAYAEALQDTLWALLNSGEFATVM